MLRCGLLTIEVVVKIEVDSNPCFYTCEVGWPVRRIWYCRRCTWRGMSLCLDIIRVETERSFEVGWDCVDGNEVIRTWGEQVLLAPSSQV